MIFRIFIDEAVAIPRVGTLRMASRIAVELQAEHPESRVVIARKRRKPLLWDARPNVWEAVAVR